MGTISVTSDFDRFCKNLRMSDTTVSNVQNRYHAITKRVNSDYWNSSSDTLHSLYVGSYGRGTSIYTSDIDIVVELPTQDIIIILETVSLRYLLHYETACLRHIVHRV